MFDIAGLPVGHHVSRIKYNWEAEHFKQWRFNLWWEGQSRASKYTEVTIIVLVSAWLSSVWGLVFAFVFNLIWSIPLTVYYERRCRQDIKDIYQLPEAATGRSVWQWVSYILKLIIFVGFKDYVVTKFLWGARWVLGRLPGQARKAQWAMVLLTLAATGIRSGHHQLTSAGIHGTNRLYWNVSGRFLNAFVQVGEAFTIGWLFSRLWTLQL